ncbi:MAG: hypothetical protein ACK5TR_04570 [Alphaproteobacteria bacterium]|jgi:hypothetical protein|nr:hypothetical protein [Alphaproteobacteria bacterium]
MIHKMKNKDYFKRVLVGFSPGKSWEENHAPTKDLDFDGGKLYDVVGKRLKPHYFFWV